MRFKHLVKRLFSPFTLRIRTGALQGRRWIVTSGSNSHQVRTAWVDGQATICTALAQAHRKATGDVSDLSGYQARDARDGLAKAYAIALPGQETADPSVISSCSDMLNKSATS